MNILVSNCTPTLGSTPVTPNPASGLLGKRPVCFKLDCGIWSVRHAFMCLFLVLHDLSLSCAFLSWERHLHLPSVGSDFSNLPDWHFFLITMQFLRVVWEYKLCLSFRGSEHMVIWGMIFQTAHGSYCTARASLSAASPLWLMLPPLPNGISPQVRRRHGFSCLKNQKNPLAPASNRGTCCLI